jgi:FkbM family methyltransferase
MAYAERASYLQSHFGMKHRLTAGISRLLDGRTYTIRHGLAKGLRRKGGLGFIPAWLAGGADDSEEVRLFLKLDLANKVVFDIGGLQGVFTLFFASRARAVVVYEPNPSSRARLEENLRLNGLTNVMVRPVALGAADGELELVFDPRMAGGATADAQIARQIRDTSRQWHSERIAVVRLDGDVEAHSLPAPDFVKIDVEGMELAVLQGMREILRRHRPSLYIEMHGATRASKRSNAIAVVDELAASGYENIIHVESGARVSRTTADLAAEGHLLCGPLAGLGLGAREDGGVVS